MSIVDAENVVLCSYLGLTARDLAEIGSFSERFVRDLLAGRRPFPKGVQNTLHSVYFLDLPMIREVMLEQAGTEDPTIFIFRTLEQLRSSPIGKTLPRVSLGTYLVAAFQVKKKCDSKGQTIHLRFAETPAFTDA